VPRLACRGLLAQTPAQRAQLAPQPFLGLAKVGLQRLDRRYGSLPIRIGQALAVSRRRSRRAPRQDGPN
jgi:hypothetical protein